MFKVGLTGGIGSGKSTVAALFAARSVPVIDADQAARELVTPGSAALTEIVQQFGERILQEDGSLNRAALRDLVFADPARRQTLESILHPRIIASMHAAAERASGSYCILVMPLLLEARQQSAVDRILAIDCPLALQRQRAMARDRASASDIDRIIASQVTRKQRLAAADDIITNDGDLQHLETQVETLHRRYLALARS